MYLLYKPLISQRYGLCNCLEILHICLHVPEQFDSHFSQIWVPSNPKGAETLPPGIITSESDLYLRRFWGNPEEVWFSNTQSNSWILQFIFFSLFPQNLKKKPRYLITFTVGYKQRQNIDACVKMAVLFVFFSKFLFLF